MQSISPRVPPSESVCACVSQPSDGTFDRGSWDRPPTEATLFGRTPPASAVLGCLPTGGASDHVAFQAMRRLCNVQPRAVFTDLRHSAWTTIFADLVVANRGPHER